MMVRLLRLASIAVCAIAIVWFAVFALDQTSSASSHQQAEVNGTAPEPAGSASGSREGRKSAVHEALDKAFSALSSPFSGIAPSSSGQWTTHVVNTLLVLLVYGFGLGFLARLLKLGL